MEQAAPLFSLGGRDCLICCKPFENYPVVQFTDKGWPSIQDNALKWKHINVPVTDPCFLYPTVCERIEGKNAFGGAHKSCRITFGTKSPIYEKRFGPVQDEKPFLTKPLLTMRKSLTLLHPHRSQLGEALIRWMRNHALYAILDKNGISILIMMVVLASQRRTMSSKI